MNPPADRWKFAVPGDAYQAALTFWIDDSGNLWQHDPWNGSEESSRFTPAEFQQACASGHLIRADI